MTERQTQVRIHHIAIQTANFEEAFRFYSEILGLRVLKKPFNYKNKRTLAWLDGGGILIELFSVKLGEEPQAFDDRRVGTVHVAFEVQDLDAFIDYLVKHGIRIQKPPFLPPTDDPDQPRVAFIVGPDEEEIELRERSRLKP